MSAYRTETVETPAGEYVIELHTDQDASNPLTDWDHSGMAFWVNYGPSNYVETNTLDEADDSAARALGEFVHIDSDQDEVVRRFNKWRAITGSPWILVAGEDSSSQSDFYRWFALVNSAGAYVASDGNSYPLWPDPVAAVRQDMEAYRTWAAGEVCGFVVTGPDGGDVESVWSFYSDDDALEEARDVVAADYPKRIEAANLVGSGFVGVL